MAISTTRLSLLLPKICLKPPLDKAFMIGNFAGVFYFICMTAFVCHTLWQVNIRCLITPVGKQAVPTVSGHFHYDASRRSKFSSSRRIGRSDTVGRLPSPVSSRRYFFSSSVRQPRRLQIPALSSDYTVAAPYPEGLEMEGDDESSTEEVVEGCLVRHGEMWNGDVKIHYVECGDKNGELVVLIHGFPNFWYVWKNQFQALAETGYHVVAPDLRGYNTSSKPKGIHNYGRRSVVSDMVCVIDELGGDKPATVVGHDWGGFVTWAIAEDFPGKVKKAVIVNVPHLSVFTEALRSSFRQIRRSWYVGFFQLPWLPELFMGSRNFKGLKGSFGTSRLQAADLDRYVRAYQNAGALEGSINYYRAAVRGHWSPSPDTPRPICVELPVDLIWGELDVYIGKELAVLPKSIAANSEIKILPCCSHWPMWDDPEQFNALLLESVRSQQTTSTDQVHISTVLTKDATVA